MRTNLFVGGLLLLSAPAFGLTINPTFVDDAAGAWTNTEKAVINQAISDWQARIADSVMVNVTLDFQNAGTGSTAYLGQWQGNYSNALYGDNIYPWQKTVHTIHFNADLMSGSTYLWFDPTPADASGPTSSQWDALSVARHEIGHMLGFTSNFYATDVGNPGQVMLWDQHITISGSSATFDQGGLNVSLASSTNLGHVLDSGSTANDLMVPALYDGARHGISETDLSMLHLAYNYTITPVPEPALVGVAIGGAMLALSSRRRRVA